MTEVLGNAGDDRLNGGLGADLLTGGAGFDTFTFSTALGDDNVDTVRDFRAFFDTIRLDNAVFTGLVAGPLAATAFHIGASADDAGNRIVYNDETGALYFDADGAGGTDQIQFATLARDPDNISASDFFVI